MPRSLGIEITEADIRVVELSQTKKEGFQMVGAFVVPTRDLARDETSNPERVRRLKAALKSHKVGASPVGLVIPKQSTTVRTVVLPGSDPAELVPMARFEAEKFIPFNVERHVISATVLRKADDTTSEVLIAAIDEPVMSGMLDVVEGAGLEASFVDVSSLALARVVTQTLQPGNAQSTQLVLQIGMVHTDITLLRGGVVLTTRSVLHGLRPLLRDLGSARKLDRDFELEELAGLNLTKPGDFLAEAPEPVPAMAASQGEQEHGVAVNEALDSMFVIPPPAPGEVATAIRGWTQRLLTNLQRTSDFTAREFNITKIDRMLLTGEGSLVGGITDVLEQQFGVRPELFSPLPSVPKSPGFTASGGPLECFIPAYGAALRVINSDSEQRINLLPPSVIERHERAERRFQYVITGTMALVALVMLYLMLDSNADHQRELLKRYEEYNEMLDVKISEFSDKKDRLEIIKSIRSGRAGILDILEAVSNYEKIGPLPKGRVTLSQVRYSLGETVDFSGMASDNEEVINFVYFLKSLENDGGRIFESVNITTSSPTNLPGREQTIYTFELSGFLNGPEEELE